MTDISRIMPIFFGILIIVFIGIALIVDQKSSKRKVKQNARNFLLIAHRREMVHLILPLINKNNLEEELNTISYEEFVLKATDKISNTVYSTLYDIKNTPIIIEKEYKHYLTKDVIHDIVDSFLVASPECSKVLEECFNDKIRKDIMEIEQTEKDHVELLKQFGEEPVGDPELHDKENNTVLIESDSEYQLNENLIDDLIKTGTVEIYDDINDNY